MSNHAIILPSEKNLHNYLRGDAVQLDLGTLLRSPISVLNGVNDAASKALEGLSIHTVFDLATSPIFDNARTVANIESRPSIVHRIGVVPRHYVDDDNLDLATDPDSGHEKIETLDGIGEKNGPHIRSSLYVDTIRDLALWPPYMASVDIFQRALYPETVEGADPEAPPDLLPRTGDYPTERVFYTKLVINDIPKETLVDLDSPVTLDISDLLFKKPALGAIVTHEQSWYPQGVALGNLLHSVALAPGESTRLAVVDWTRKMRGSTEEETTQTEVLTNDAFHNRSIGEVTSAVAQEIQSGASASASGAMAVNQRYGCRGRRPPWLASRSIWDGNGGVLQRFHGDHSHRYIRQEGDWGQHESGRDGSHPATSQFSAKPTSIRN